MFVLVMFFVGLLLIGACGGSGVVLQQILHVVDKPLEFATPGQVDVEPVPVPPARPDPMPEPEPVEPVAEPVAPVPVRPAPRPTPREPQPVAPPPSEPEPAAPEPVEDPVEAVEPGPVLAPIALRGDAAEVRVLGREAPHTLPASLPPGRYDVEVRFTGGEPFIAASLLVMDAQPQTVACRQALGICTVR